MGQAYEAYTYNDPNLIKRWLHRDRFNYALKILDLKKEDKFLDYGAGDGHFLKILAEKNKSGDFTGYEPYSGMFKQGQEKLKETKIKFYNQWEEVKKNKYDKICSLDTCEHLTDQDLEILFNNINSLLSEGGIFLVTVPIETGLPALIKNSYRYLKKKNYDNLNFKNYIKSILGLKIERKVGLIDKNIKYIFSHIGFDGQEFELKLAKFFKLEKKISKPFPFLGNFLNNTRYYLLKKR